MSVHRESREMKTSGQTSTVREFTTNQTSHVFVDRSIDSSHLYLYQSKAMLGDRSTPVFDVKLQFCLYEPMDDRVTLVFSMAPP